MTSAGCLGKTVCCFVVVVVLSKFSFSDPPSPSPPPPPFFFQSAVRRRDGLQLENDKAAEERENKKKVHDEVSGAVLAIY